MIIPDRYFRHYNGDERPDGLHVYETDDEAFDYQRKMLIGLIFWALTFIAGFSLFAGIVLWWLS